MSPPLVDEIARERISDHDRRIEKTEEQSESNRLEISDVKRTTVKVVTNLEEVISFHKDLKGYAKMAIAGIVALIFAQVWQMIVKH